ncbi:MAG: VWA domain-containing protein [Polyangiaceae bacterium]
MRLLVVCASVASCISLAVACGSSSDDGAGGAGPAASGVGGAGASGGGGSLGVGAGAAACDPPCADGEVCSVAGSCILEGTCLEDGDCSDGTVCDTDANTCVPGGECGSQEATVEAVPPNLLVVLDRSCSMTEAVANQTKWDIAVAALTTMTTTFAGDIRFGLNLFPDKTPDSCAQTEVPVPIGPGTEQAIQDLLAAALVNGDLYFPNGPCVTNIDTAMEQAAADLALQDPNRQSYVLLLTDGKQAGCDAAGGDPGTTQIITDLWANQVGTFVLGFGNGIDADQMNAFADAGGVPNADPQQRYYQAEDQASLDAVLTTIATATLGCTFSLDETPPDASKIFVFFDNTESIARDATHMQGWDYDPATNQVTFYGDDCQQLKDGTVTDVDVVFGCNEPTPD